MEPEKRTPPQTETRKISLDRETVKPKERTVDLAFSSEFPVVRGWGIEVLSHEPGAMRSVRTKDGLPIINEHNPTGGRVGRLRDIRLCDKDKKARGTAIFSRNQIGEEALRDIEDGILTDVSVGYRVHFAEEMKASQMDKDMMELAAKEKLPVYRITDWEPYECSFVASPADPTVGIGRTVEAVKEEVEVPEAIATNQPPIIEIKEERTMSEDKKTLEQIEADVQERTKKAAKDAADAATARVQGINELYERFASYVPKFVRDKAVNDGMPLAEFQKLVLARVESGKPIDLPAELGLSRKEVNSYSVTRAILSQWKEAKVDAGFELACHQELVKRGFDQQKGGILVPTDIMRQSAVPGGTGRRDLDTTSSSGAVGGYLVGTDNLGSEFIDLLRNSLIIRRAGAKVLSGLRGNVTIPKRTVGVVSYWVGEGVAPTEGSNTYAQVSLSPKNVGANLDYTRNLLLQSNPSIDALVNGDLASSLATAIDLAAFHGTGSAGQPQGIVGSSGVGSVTATSVNLTKMLEFQTDVAGSNALAANCAYVTTPAVAGILASQPRFTYGTRPLWEGNLLESPDCCGFRGFATNQITAGYCIFGDFSQVLIGEWGPGLELVVDPYTQSKTGIIQVTAFQTIDIGIRYGGAFSVSTSVTAP